MCIKNQIILGRFLVNLWKILYLTKGNCDLDMISVLEKIYKGTTNKSHHSYLYTLVIFMCCSLLTAFNTLDSNRVGWRTNPSFTILNTSSMINDGSDLAAVRDSFAAWQAVAGSSLRFQEVNGNADITMEFLSNWPAWPDAPPIKTSSRPSPLKSPLLINGPSVDCL